MIYMNQREVFSFIFLKNNPLQPFWNKQDITQIFWIPAQTLGQNDVNVWFLVIA